MLPTELIRQIVLLTLDDVPIDPEPPISSVDIIKPSGSTSKAPWTLIRSLTLASKLYRAISLEAWFRTFYAKSPEDLSYADLQWPEIGSQWARELHLVQETLFLACTWDLKNFTRTTTLRLDWLSSIAPQASDTPGPLFINAAPNLTELDIRGLPWASPLVLDFFTRCFLELRVLHMTQKTTWCALCNTSTLPSFEEPGPEKICYDSVVGLPIHYRKTLHPLTNLHTVVFTVGKLVSGSTSLSNANNPNKWSGECDSCMELLYADETYRAEWVSKKTRIVPDRNTLEQYELPSLRRVEWIFQTTTDEEDIYDDSSDSTDVSWDYQE